MNPGFIEKFTNKPEPPERIYGWMNSQLSISRHYGGCTYQGARYHIAPNEEGQPLVRADVIAREAEEAKRAKCKAWHDAKVAAKAAQGDLI